MPYDMRDYGSVFYRSTTDADILSIVADMIVDINPNFSHYRPELAVVVTWERAPQFFSAMVGAIIDPTRNAH